MNADGGRMPTKCKVEGLFNVPVKNSLLYEASAPQPRKVLRLAKETTKHRNANPMPSGFIMRADNRRRMEEPGLI